MLSCSQPAPTIVLASLGACAPLALIQVVLGVGVVVFGLVHAGTAISVAGVLAWLVLLARGDRDHVGDPGTVRLGRCSGHWDSVSMSLYEAVWQFGRYPVQLYRAPLQLIFTYVFPIALVATVPVGVLARGDGLAAVPVALATAATACTITALVWRAGLRRYTSATS